MIGTDKPDKPDPVFRLWDATAGPEGPFVLADSDQFRATRLPFVYVTNGPAADLPLSIKSPQLNLSDNDPEPHVPAVNHWEVREIREALKLLNWAGIASINYEDFSGKKGSTVRHYRLAIERLLIERPDLHLAFYNVSPTIHSQVWEQLAPADRTFACVSVYPGKFAERRIRLIEQLLDSGQIAPEYLICITGYEWQGEDRPSDEKILERVRSISASLAVAGVCNMGVWDNPPRPGVQGRTEHYIQDVAQIIVETFSPATLPLDPPLTSPSDAALSEPSTDDDPSPNPTPDT